MSELAKYTDLENLTVVDMKGLVQRLVDDNEAYAQALSICATAQVYMNAAKRICATTGKNPTLRQAVDEAARMRYERDGEVKRAIRDGDSTVGELTCVLTKEVEARKVKELVVHDMDEFIDYVSDDNATLKGLIKYNEELLLDWYFNDGVVPGGCELLSYTAPKQPQVFKNTLLRVKDIDSLIARMSDIKPNLEIEG